MVQKIRKIMNDFSTDTSKVKFSEALWIHIQDTRYNKLKNKKQRKRGVK